MHAESKPHRPEPSDHELEYAWRRGKLIIILGDGEAVPVDKVDGDATATVKKEVIVHNSGGQIENLFVEPIIIKLRPKLVRIRHYLRGETRRAERIYPKSTGGWYGRMESGIEMAAFIVHSIVDEDGSWLTVIDPNSAEILESHRVRPFEAEALVPSPPPRYDLMPDDSTAGRRKILEPLLNQAPPTWKQLYSLTRGISLAPLRTGDSMREAMDYLVPKRWSQSVREEVMAFLSLIVTGQDELTEDPVTYFDRLKVTPSLRTLLVIHQIALLGGLEVPDYLSIFHEKTRSELLAMRWYDAFSEFERPALVFNNPFTDVARQYIAKLNKQEGFALRLPISSSEAAKSREARLHRLVLLYQGIGISGRVNRRAIGLKTLYYLGKAHGWPHRHLSFSARLGEDDENPLLLHEIVVPPDAAEQLLRMRSGLMQRDWYHRWENHGALQESQKQVQREMDRIKQNLEVGVSEKRLLRRFHIKDPSPYELKNSREVQIVDILGTRVYLANLELPAYLNAKRLTMTQFKETLERLTHVGVLSLFYERNWKNVSELILLASGKRERVQSLIYQIVRSSVGGFVASLDSGKTFLSGIRLSNKMANQVYESLPSYCLEAGINIRVEDLREFRSFRSDLYQRIWQGRGVWDSDVSGMLSQISVQQSQA